MPKGTGPRPTDVDGMALYDEVEEQCVTKSHQVDDYLMDPEPLYHEWVQLQKTMRHVAQQPLLGLLSWQPGIYIVKFMQLSSNFFKHLNAIDLILAPYMWHRWNQ